MSAYLEELRGVVALPQLMECSLADFARRLRLAIEEEQRKPNPDNRLIALLCDAARCGWELIKVAKRRDEELLQEAEARREPEARR